MFANFLKFGSPMQIVQMIVSVSVVMLDSRWWIGWIVGFGVFVVFISRKLVPIIVGKVKGGKEEEEEEKTIHPRKTTIN